MRPLLTRLVVHDTSMQPALRPGDRLLVSGWLAARAGDVAAVRDPEFPGTWLIKRVVRRQPDGSLLVIGDNPNVSRDSRTFGPVPAQLVVGRAIWRYLPRARRGRIGRGRSVEWADR